MCLILIAYRLHPHRPLVLAANRDEFYARPAEAAHWWPGPHDGTRIFGGRDLEARGTWLAVSEDGRLAGVTNWTEDRSAPPAPRSRGELPSAFLAGDDDARTYIELVDGAKYAGYNFIGFDGQELIYASNRTGEIRALKPGVYGLTNTRLGPGSRNGKRHADTATGRKFAEWPKAVFGAKALERIAASATAGDLIDLLAQPHVPLETPADRELAPERSYSPAFIHGDEYGTRASTAVIVGTESIDFVEQLYGPRGKPSERQTATIST